MALFKPCRVTRAELLNLPKKAGQIIYVLDTGEICMDIAVDVESVGPKPMSINEEEEAVEKSLPANQVATLSDEEYDNSIYRFFINRGRADGNKIKAQVLNLNTIDSFTADFYKEDNGDSDYHYLYVEDENLIYNFYSFNQGDLVEGQTDLYNITFNAEVQIYKNEYSGIKVLNGYSSSYVNTKRKFYTLAGIFNKTTNLITNIEIIYETVDDDDKYVGEGAAYCSSVEAEEQYRTLFLNIDDKTDNVIFNDTIGNIDSVLERLDTGEGV